MLAWEESLDTIELRRRPLDDDGDEFEDGDYDFVEDEDDLDDVDDDVAFGDDEE